MPHNPQAFPKGPTPATQRSQPCRELHALRCPQLGPAPRGLMTESCSGLAVVPRLALRVNNHEIYNLSWDVSDCRGAQGLRGDPFRAQAGGGGAVSSSYKVTGHGRGLCPPQLFTPVKSRRQSPHL